jgi:hypothetical protein
MQASLVAWIMGLDNGQNKKAAPSCYKAGLVTAFKVLTETGGLSDSHSPNSPPPAPLKTKAGEQN